MGGEPLMVLLASGGGPLIRQHTGGQGDCDTSLGPFNAGDLLSLSCQRTINFLSKYKT